MATKQAVRKHKERIKVRRPGIHAKSKMSIHKSSKHYIKLSVGQG
jgi:hypothetical protein